MAMYCKSVPHSFSQSVLCVLQEAERVMDTFNEHLHLPVTKVDDAGARYLLPPVLSCCVSLRLHLASVIASRQFCLAAATVVHSPAA